MNIGPPRGNEKVLLESLNFLGELVNRRYLHKTKESICEADVRTSVLGYGGIYGEAVKFEALTKSWGNRNKFRGLNA